MERILVIIGIIFFLNAPVLSQVNDPYSKEIEKARKEGKVILNFKNADISSVVKFMSELTGKNIILDPKVRGKITLTSSKPIPLNQAWSIFTLALNLQGYGVIEKKGIVRIMPSSQAVSFADVQKPKDPGQIGIYIYTAENTDAQQLLNAVRPFLSNFARVSVHNPSNSIIVSDTGLNINKLKKLLKQLDRKDIQSVLRIYRLKYIPAEEVQRAISPLSGLLQRKYGNQVLFATIKSANSLVVFAPEEAQKQIKNLIDHLDKEVAGIDQRSYYVIPLQFTSVDEVSETLKSLFQRGGRVTRKLQPPRIRRQEVQQPKPTSPGPTGRTQPAPAPKKRVQKAGQPKGISIITTREGMRIGFDRGTNSIILYATPSEYKGIKKLIEKIDIRRKQVLIAVTIAEVSLSSLLELGVRWQIIGKQGSAVFGGTSLNDIYSAFSSGSFLLGTFSRSGTEVQVGTTKLFFPDLVLLFSLIEKGSGFNIISNPKIMTLDNQEATIKVGQVVPFASGVKFDINGQPIITYDYREVGLELNVVPSVSGDNLRLSVDLQLQEIIRFETPQIGGISYTVPVTSNRFVNSDIVVENGQTVILGGLVSSKTIRAMEGIPVLHRIPLLGYLFKRSKRESDKTTLFVFITPYIIESPEELTKITEEHKKISEELERLIKQSEEEQRISEEEDEEDL